MAEAHSIRLIPHNPQVMPGIQATMLMNRRWHFAFATGLALILMAQSGSISAQARRGQGAQKKKYATKKLSREEELRQERMRMRSAGPVNFNASGRAISTENGDLVLFIKDGEKKQLTETPGAEIAPQLSADGKFVAYVREHALYGMTVDDKKETRLSPAAVEGLGYGEAEFVAQEEMTALTGSGSRPMAQQLFIRKLTNVIFLFIRLCIRGTLNGM